MHENGVQLQKHLEESGLAVDGPVDIQDGSQITVRNGAQLVTVAVYEKRGKCVARGAKSDLLDLVNDLCTKVNDGTPLPKYLGDDELSGIDAALAEADIDPTVLKYIQEAVEAARHELHMSSMFLLGGASERMIYILIDALLDAIKDETQRAAAYSAKLTSSFALERLNHLNDRLTKVEKQIPAEVRPEWENNIRMVADFYRRTRNEVGHPVAPPNFDGKQVRFSLVMAKGYFLALHRLISYLRTAELVYPVPKSPA